MDIKKEHKELRSFDGDVLDKVEVQDFIPGQNYDTIVREFQKTGGRFRDDVFPPQDSSLFFRHNPHPEGKIQWKRISDLHPRPRLFVGGADPDDVNQGEIGNCWFVAGLSLMASKKCLLTRVIPDYTDRTNSVGVAIGIYRFRFFRLGIWVEVVVDDYLPVYEGRFIYTHSKDKGEFWSSLVEKAYAKLNGSYEALVGGVTEDALTDFTGGISEKFDLGATGVLVQHDKARNFHSIIEVEGEKKKTLFDICDQAMDKPALMSASIDIDDESLREVRTSLGLIQGHAYGVTGMARLHSGQKLIRLRNPWGRQEWTGDWSDNSPCWDTVSVEDRAEFLEQVDDGQFWMSWNDFATHFTSLSITRLFNTSLTKSQRFVLHMDRGSWRTDEHTAGGCLNYKDSFLTENRQFSMRVDRDQVVIIGLMQNDKRENAELGEQNLSIGFYVFSVETNRVLRLCEFPKTMVGKSTFANAREVVLRLELFQGHYFIIPATFKSHQDGEYLIRVYSETDVEMHEVITSVPRAVVPLWGEPQGRLLVRVAHAGVRSHKKAKYYCLISIHGKSARTHIVDDAAPVFDEELTFEVAKRKQPLTIKLLESKKIMNSLIGSSKVDLARWYQNPNMTGTTQANLSGHSFRTVGKVELEITYVIGFADPFARSRVSAFEQGLKMKKLYV
eukprot:c7639_g1_i1.p1 GENE.c7639_g1_i1~~c7639_g1_i1.p1  ORF type:complete len:681 (+),score=116.72 c7639_g1_i1:33-2045(+)